MGRQIRPRILNKNEDRKAILESYKTSLMSDAKWRKVFAALEEVDPGLKVIIKWVGVDDPKRMSLPVTDTPFPQAWAYFDARPEPLRSIEWAEVRREDEAVRGAGFAPVRKSQAIDEARDAISSLGKLPVAETPGGFRIIGHLPNGAPFPGASSAL